MSKAKAKTEEDVAEKEPAEKKAAPAKKKTKSAGELIKELEGFKTLGNPQAKTLVVDILKKLL